MAADTQYAYAVSRIRVFEKRMLDKSKLDRMIDAKTPEDAFKVLIEAEYGSKASGPEQVFRYERLLKEELVKVIELIREISPQPELFDVFWLKFDYHNLKVFIKGEFSGSMDDGILSASGTIPPEKLRLLFKERKLSRLPERMGAAAAEAMDAFNRTSDPQMIDLVLDRAAFSQMLETAKASGSPFLTGLVQAMVDLANMNAFLRIKRLDKPWDFLSKALLPGGLIDTAIYRKNQAGALESFVNDLRRTPYHKVCEEGIGSFEATGSLTRLEKLSDDYILGYVKRKKYVVMGLEPLVGYLIARQMEIRNAGIIMAGKINHISGEIIKERLRETYV